MDDKMLPYRNSPSVQVISQSSSSNSSSPSPSPSPMSSMEKKDQEQTDSRRPFRCGVDGCTKSFTKASRLKRHRVTHDANRQRFYCNKDDCNRSYGTKYDLLAHQK